METNFVPVPISHLLRHPTYFEFVEVHVKIAEKYVRLNFAEEPFNDILTKLLKKNVVHVYLSEEDFEQVLAKFQQLINEDQNAHGTSDELRASQAETAIALSRDFIKRYGVNQQVLNVVKESNQNIQTILSNSPGLFAFVKKFKENCSEEFLKVSVTNFLCANVIATFPWQTPQIIEKTMLAGLFCDLSLEVHDFDEIKALESGEGQLSDRVKRHPLSAMDILSLKRDLIPQETLTIIEQHHERPDGKGFPYGITVTRFNQLSAIFIVCQRFTDELFESEFDYTKHHATVEKLRTIYEGGVFTKAMDALIAVVEK